MIRKDVEGSSRGLILGIVHCFVFGRWRSQWSWRTGLGCGELVTGRCSFAWNFSVTRWTVLTGWRQGTRPNMMLSLHLWLAPSLPFENSTSQKPCTVLYQYYFGICLKCVSKTTNINGRIGRLWADIWISNFAHTPQLQHLLAYSIQQ
jgi:hypothetical protein